MDRRQHSMQLELEDLQIQLTRNELAVRLLQTLLDLAGAQHNVKTFDDEVTLLNKLIDSQKAKEAEIDLSNYQVRLAQADGQANLSRNLVKQKRRDLVRLGGSSTYKEEIQFNSNVSSSVFSDFPTLDDFLSRSENESLQLRLQRIAVQIANTSVTRSSRDSYPTVDLVANGVITRGAPTFPHAQTAATAIGLQVNLPLSYGGSTSVLRSEAISLESRAKNDLEAQRKFIQQGISDSYHELQNLRTQLKTEDRLSIIYAMRNQPIQPDLGTSVEFYFASIELEEKVTRLQASREVHRLHRDGLMQKFRLWAASGPLEKHHYQLISDHFR